MPSSCAARRRLGLLLVALLLSAHAIDAKSKIAERLQAGAGSLVGTKGAAAGGRDVARRGGRQFQAAQRRAVVRASAGSRAAVSVGHRVTRIGILEGTLNFFGTIVGLGGVFYGLAALGVTLFNPFTGPIVAAVLAAGTLVLLGLKLAKYIKHKYDMAFVEEVKQLVEQAGQAAANLVVMDGVFMHLITNLQQHLGRIEAVARIDRNHHQKTVDITTQLVSSWRQGASAARQRRMREQAVATIQRTIKRQHDFLQQGAILLDWQGNVRAEAKDAEVRAIFHKFASNLRIKSLKNAGEKAASAKQALQRVVRAASTQQYRHQVVTVGTQALKEVGGWFKEYEDMKAKELELQRVQAASACIVRLANVRPGQQQQQQQTAIQAWAERARAGSLDTAGDTEGADPSPGRRKLLMRSRSSKHGSSHDGSSGLQPEDSQDEAESPHSTMSTAQEHQFWGQHLEPKSTLRRRNLEPAQHLVNDELPRRHDEARTIADAASQQFQDRVAAGKPPGGEETKGILAMVELSQTILQEKHDELAEHLEPLKEKMEALKERWEMSAEEEALMFKWECLNLALALTSFGINVIGVGLFGGGLSKAFEEAQNEHLWNAFVELIWAPEETAASIYETYAIAAEILHMCSASAHAVQQSNQLSRTASSMSDHRSDLARTRSLDGAARERRASSTEIEMEAPSGKRHTAFLEMGLGTGPDAIDPSTPPSRMWDEMHDKAMLFERDLRKQLEEKGNLVPPSMLQAFTDQVFGLWYSHFGPDSIGIRIGERKSPATPIFNGGGESTKERIKFRRQRRGVVSTTRGEPKFRECSITFKYLQREEDSNNIDMNSTSWKSRGKLQL